MMLKQVNYDTVDHTGRYLPFTGSLFISSQKNKPLLGVTSLWNKTHSSLAEPVKGIFLDKFLITKFQVQ
ncbi:hypothetical protein RM549_03395 [Salegentibacter sp. F188]|uniref:Uncharacterized protein n=1 Tax=Autumnicola patrickiae TaxID=3075591 RepID=A0ABU3DYL3_9FLAO|nr:hypothetical protein [Salegentibacter sp. F188]MDT0688811.1 hypothetical protein [Salegentibacter sp. F188]